MNDFFDMSFGDDSKSNDFAMPTFDASNDIDDDEDNDLEESSNKFKKTLFGGYTRGSVEAYVEQIEQNVSQMQGNLEFQIKEMLLEKASLSQENALLKSQFTDAESKMIEIEEEYKRIKGLNEELAENIKNQELQFSTELNQYKTVSGELQEELDKISSHYQSLQEQLERAHGEVSVLTQQVKENEEENIKVEQYLDQLESSLQEKNRALEESVRLLKEKEIELETSNAEVHELREQMLVMETKLAEKDSEIARTMKILEEYQAQEENFMALIDQKEDMIIERNNALQEAARMVESLESQREAFESRLMDQQGTIDEQQESIEHTQYVLDEKEEEIKTLELKIQQLTDAVEAMNSQDDLAVETLTNEVEFLTKKLDLMTSEKDETVMLLQEKIQNLTQQLEQVQLQPNIMQRVEDIRTQYDQLLQKKDIIINRLEAEVNSAPSFTFDQERALLKQEIAQLQEELKQEMIDKYQVRKGLNDEVRRLKERLDTQTFQGQPRQDFERIIDEKDTQINQLFQKLQNMQKEMEALMGRVNFTNPSHDALQERTRIQHMNIQEPALDPVSNFVPTPQVVEPVVAAKNDFEEEIARIYKQIEAQRETLDAFMDHYKYNS